MTDRPVYYVGQKPLAPLAIPLTDAAGNSITLSDYDTVEIEFYGPDGAEITSLYGGATTVVDNKAVFTWGTSGSVFSAGTGIYTIRVLMTTTEGNSERSDPIELEVRTDQTYTTFITPDEAFRIAGVTPTSEEIHRATAIIETELGVDLTGYPYQEGSTFFTDVSSNDVRHLMNAIAWQISYMASNPDAFTAQANIASASANGVSVTYNGGDGLLAPLAAKCLARLSWRRKTVKTISPVASRYPWLVSQNLVDDVGYQQWSPL
jgi:hypothetical protein